METIKFLMSYMNLHEHKENVAGNSKSLMDMWQETIPKLGTITGPGEDKNRNMTSMSETRIKLSCNGV